MSLYQLEGLPPHGGLLRLEIWPVPPAQGALPPIPATTTAPLIVPQAAPARLRDAAHVWAASYSLVVGEAAAATWTARAVATATISAQSHQARSVARSMSRVEIRGRTHQTVRAAPTATLRSSPWDSILETDDELLLLLD